VYVAEESLQMRRGERESKRGGGRKDLPETCDVLEGVLLPTIEVDFCVLLAPHDAVPNYDGVLDLCQSAGCTIRIVKGAHTPLAFLYSASRYRKSCFVFQLKRGDRSMGRRVRNGVPYKIMIM
jgi:hypothetical protein